MACLGFEIIDGFSNSCPPSGYTIYIIVKPDVIPFRIVRLIKTYFYGCGAGICPYVLRNL